MLHALAFNPSEEQIAKLCENVRYLRPGLLRYGKRQFLLLSD